MSADSDLKTTRTRTWGAVVGVAVAAAALAACSGTDTTGQDKSSAVATVSLPPFTPPSVQSWPGRSATFPTPPPVPSALPRGVRANRADPSSVATAAARIWFGWDTVTDRSPYEAAVRATPLMTQRCAQRITATPPTGSPDADWTALARVHARVQATATIGSEERPADSATTAVRVVAVTQEFTADKPLPDRHPVAVVTMTRDSAGWSVTDDGQHGCGVVTR
ncbi:hypothetical protein [Williamsia herbipolensis]|uniref:hypothetical protein n=1 Tax=Williamsia herbipolensis TaxID=1603258 RepID=UPI0012377786|nr:hypothetical protein [Williamsia herbipolensis]